MIRRIVVLVAIYCLTAPVAAQNETQIVFTGMIDDTNTSKDYPLTLSEGDAVFVSAEAASGDLDPVITLYHPNGSIVASNDDRGENTYNSAFGFIAPDDGAYTLTLSRYEYGESSGRYRLTIDVGDTGVLEPLWSMPRVTLSGDVFTFDTDHFRIHYTRDGEDQATKAYVEAVAQAFEESWHIQIDQMGWNAPPSDGYLGDNALLDVYLIDLIGSGEGALGYSAPETIVGDNPLTREIEARASTSYIAIDNDFDDVEFEDYQTPITVMRATVAHEFHHAVQFGYDADEPHHWLFEATATWMETAAMSKDQDATGYVAYAYTYPELCFGTGSDPGYGDLMYGEWMFLQHLTDDFGDDAVRQLWRSLVKYDGFAALEQLLTAHGTTLAQAMARYRLKNLARDYDLAPLFNATVWMEDRITAAGRWSSSGEGIQEFGANYFEFALQPGMYTVGLVGDNARLQLWAVGLRNGALDAYLLGSRSAIDTNAYDATYLMVFNPNYDEDTDDCTYYDYEIEVTRGKGRLTPLNSQWDARYFERLQ